LEIGGIQPSAKQDFPTNYQFIGLQIWAGDVERTTERSRYNIMNFLKELGGLMKISMVLGGLFVSRFGQN
jgi:hypothetical protein